MQATLANVKGAKSAELGARTVMQLKAQCTQHGLRKTGMKAEFRTKSWHRSKPSSVANIKLTGLCKGCTQSLYGCEPAPPSKGGRVLSG